MGICVSYIIILCEDLTDTMLNASQNDPEGLRYSVDGTKAIVKFDTLFPDVAQGYTKYSYSEILEILDSEEWTIGAAG